ncbi:MAG: hypothetical protein JWM98_1187 [Thermoleophilia bacterium]|nr:hypothetical protein [Thermoleophilia bacterium]
MSASPAVVAAWFPDPADPARLRWWDGAAWTEHVHPPQPALTAVAADASPVARFSAVLRDDAAWVVWPDRCVVADPHDVPRSARPGARRWPSGLLVFFIVSFVGPFAGVLTRSVPLTLLVVLAVVAEATRRSRRWDGLLADDYVAQWCAERGLEQTGHPMELYSDRGPVPGAAFAEAVAPLEALRPGVRATTCVGAVGAPWRAASGATIVEFLLERPQKGRSGGPDQEFTAVCVPLPEEVARRLPGVAIDLGGRVRREVAEVALGHGSWEVVSLEQAERVSGVEVSVPPETDRLAVVELIDPAFLERLSVHAARLTGNEAQVGVLVKDGVLVTWSLGSLLTDTAARRLARARGQQHAIASEPEVRLEELVELARDAHRRTYAEWR